MFISFEKSLIFRGLKFLLYVIVAFVSLEIRVYAQKEVKPEELFYNYLSQKFQEKKLPENISKKVWNYLSDPSKGYKSAGLSSEEFASIVRDYSMSVFSKRIVEFCLEVLKIDTRENLSDEKKRENLMKYIKHVERLADAFNLSVINLQNKYLVVYSDGEQPPLGIVGKIKTSDNYIKIDEPVYRDGFISASPVVSSKLAMELAMVSAGILNSIKLKPRNRVIFYIDLSLSLQNNVDILFNSYELAPINLILDSAFPFVCAEYGYAFIRIVQNITEDTKKMRIKRIVSDGAEYQTPTNAKMCVDSGKYDNIGIKERISRFLNRYSKVDVSFSEEDYCIKFSVSISQKGQLQKNALDYLVLFLTENPDLYQDSVKLFEYLRRNVVMNPSGKSLGISKFHPLLRGTEVVLKKVVVNGSICSADIYIRFPFGLDSSALVQKIRNSVSAFNSKEYADIEVYVNAYNPIAVDVNSEVANKLRRAYSDVVGRVDKCVVTDGIYSKLFPNSIGFGPDFSDMAKVNKLAEKDIMQIFNIYLTAMIYLMER